MSVKEAGKSSSGPFSFSDQISSRLQRWVQRTAHKRRDGEKSPTMKVCRESKHIKDKDLDIKKCTSQEPLTKNSRDTRTIQELENALKDLINNCVTNSKGISTPTNDKEDTLSFVGDEVQIKTIVNENDDANEVCFDRSETNKDFGTNIDRQSVQGRHGKNLSEVLSPSGVAKAPVIDSETVRPISEGELEGVSKQLVVQTTTGIQQHASNSRRKTSEENESILSESSQGDQDININEKVDEGPNHISRNVGTSSWVNISARNANNGLSAESSNENESGRVNISGYDSPQNSNKARTTAEGIKTNEKNTARKQKPPLRRIQSEGDAIEKRLSFKDRDVKEFAETCIRHAQRKRFSEVGSLQINPELFNCDLTETETGEHRELVTLKCDALRNNLKSPPPAKDHRNVFELETFWTGTSSTPQCVKNAAITTRHKPVTTGRPSSISFPLEKPKGGNISKNSFFKPKNTSKSLNSSPTSPQSAISPKFKKFPHQPVFYVPKASDVSPRFMAKNERSGSLTESSSTTTYGNSEHLI